MDTATWLVAHIPIIRQDEWAPQPLAELKQLQAQLCVAVDNREYPLRGRLHNGTGGLPTYKRTRLGTPIGFRPSLSSPAVRS